MSEKVISNKITRTGKVVSVSGAKSIVVLVERIIKHPKIGKRIKRSAKYHAHDESQLCQVGDLVKIIESKPYSKTKRWSLLELVEKAS